MVNPAETSNPYPNSWPDHRGFPGGPKGKKCGTVGYALKSDTCAYSCRNTEKTKTKTNDKESGGGSVGHQSTCRFLLELGNKLETSGDGV